MVNLKYKIVYGYEPDNYIPIDADELEKAKYAHMELARAMFRAGSADFSRGGIFVQPDYNAAMGWTRGYTLTSYDFAEIESKGFDRAHRDFEEKVMQRIAYLKSQGRETEIGTGVKLPELDKPTTERREGGVKRIGEIMS